VTCAPSKESFFSVFFEGGFFFFEDREGCRAMTVCILRSKDSIEKKRRVTKTLSPQRLETTEDSF
jgi:hypothetical protein